MVDTRERRHPSTVTLGTFVTPDHLCPDLLRLSQIGQADCWRGRVVRLFFFCLQIWPTAAERRREIDHA